MTSVLLIDDDGRIRRTIRRYLTRAGFQVIEAENGKEALVTLLNGGADIDVVISDLNMPEMNGYELLASIKNVTNLAHLPILMLTGNTDTEDVVKALEMGANDYLRKPVDDKELVARIKTLARMKTAEDQLRKSMSLLEHEAAIGNLAAGVAHDFNNILFVMSFAELIQMGLIEIENEMPEDLLPLFQEKLKKIRHYCSGIIESQDFGKTLCTGITDFARGGTEGKHDQDMEPLVIKPLNIFDRKLKNRGISLNLDFEKDLPQIVCNGGEVQRMVLNLITNAVCALEELNPKEPHLNIGLKRNNGSVNLSVEDNGSGIPEDVQTRIFDNLFTTKEKGKGSGIGLATVKKIMEEHGGGISMNSMLGKGTRFVLSFPVNPVSPEM